jgi:hypothetical protein
MEVNRLSNPPGGVICSKANAGCTTKSTLAIDNAAREARSPYHRLHHCKFCFRGKCPDAAIGRESVGENTKDH